MHLIRVSRVGVSLLFTTFAITKNDSAMRHLFTTLLFILLGAMTTTFVGCEGDDTPTPPQEQPNTPDDNEDDDVPSEPEEPNDPEDVKPVVESTLSYKWGNTSVDKPLQSAYLEETAEGVIYTLCVDIPKTYYVYEDSIFLRFEAYGKSADESFELNLATTTESFGLQLCDPIKGLDYSADNSNREGLTGEFKVEQGVVMVAFTSAEVEATITYGGDYRSVNECIDVVDNGRELLFTPASVLLDNSDAETYKIYVSSKTGVTTVDAMADAEVVVTYPAAGWDVLTSGNFVSGSGYAMTFIIGDTTHVKGEGDTIGMNCQFITFDAASTTLTLNANLYTTQGGVAIYYEGGFVLVE